MKKTRICIVEDNLDIQNSLKEWLDSSDDFTCVGAFSNAETALIEIPRHDPDVVLMDIRLPRQSGIACIAKLRQILPSLQVIVITVYRNRDLLYDALKAGASGYLLKRSTPEEVSHAIREVCSGGAPMTPEIARMLVETFRKPASAAQIDKGGKDSESQDELSERELQVLTFVARGLSNKEIGAQLEISFFTVRAHLRKIYEKLHVRCRTEAVIKHLYGKA